MKRQQTEIIDHILDLLTELVDDKPANQGYFRAYRPQTGRAGARPLHPYR